MKGENCMYKFVTDKAFLKSSYSFCADLVNQLVQELRHYDIESCMEVIGSGRHGFITQYGNRPIDFDFNLWIIEDGGYSDGRELKEAIMEAFDYILEKNGYDGVHCKDSTSVITVGKFHQRKGNQTEYSIDLGIVKEDERGNWHRLIHQKTGIVQMDRWIWNIGPDSREIFAKEEFLKNGHWNEVRCAYLEKKNAYINVSTKPSFICYIEAINDVYNQYHKNVSRNIGGFYSIWGQGDFLMGNIFDYSNGEFIFGNSEGDSFMSQDGHLMSRMSDTSMLDLQTGEMHITSSNGYDDFENKMYGFDDEDDPFKLF